VLEGEAVLLIDGKPDRIFRPATKGPEIPFRTGGPLRDASFNDSNTLKVLRICAAAETRPLASPAP
jgi:hypothetical protein